MLDDQPIDALNIQKGIIDDFTDVCLKDKMFFKIWAEFMFLKYLHIFNNLEIEM